ncbi:DUF1552 domain-containing protein [Limnoglobus roseus]|uniref:DUF1552 domain-containing protein n=1 Tax=Limnoglobus roseus TaxID=2598579 RepID=A0A5C1A8J3_9BACT|nr:DUF1552 domain-containing protein [Limnoglobus roseus]QEL13464.1 hypothetical protein PX52LOC_00321 [Limnoglobus roseus]
MGIKSKPLSRRRFLRGAGVALGLPLLEAMTPTRAAAAEAVAPVRAAYLYFPNGAWMDAWIPKQTGKDFDLPFSLTPLAPVRESVVVLSGLDKPFSRTGDGHYAKTANFLTGLHVRKTTGQDLNSGGASVDQVAANHMGQLTPLPSLELATDPVINGLDRAVNYTRMYGSYISWRRPDLPMPRLIDPRAAFERMFGPRDAEGKPLPRPSRADDQSLLDAALEDAHSLRRKLGKGDQQKLEEYLDAVRGVEKQMGYGQPTAAKANRWKPPTKPDRLVPPPSLSRAGVLFTSKDNGGDQIAAAGGTTIDPPELVRLMLDLIVLAFWTDTTRNVTFMFANDVSPRNFSFLDGVKENHHSSSHHSNQPAKIEDYKAITRWHVEQYARLLSRLQEVKEGERTLLDNAMVVCGSSLSDGNKHDPNNLPILLGGKGGGRIRTGQHLASPKNTPLCNLYLSMLDCMGVPVTRFGDSTERLRGLMG